MQQAHGAFRKFMLDRNLDVVDAARFMAMVSVAYADGLIACFDAKYTFPFWRPITAIRAGDTDGNDATEWRSHMEHLLPGTPNHPEYPSAHSCITPAAGRVIARFLGTNEIDFTIPSLTGLGDRHYDRPTDLEYDVATRASGAGSTSALPSWTVRNREEHGELRSLAQLPEVEFLGSSLRCGCCWCPRRSGAGQDRPREESDER